MDQMWAASENPLTIMRVNTDSSNFVSTEVPLKFGDNSLGTVPINHPVTHMLSVQQFEYRSKM